jgi:hypothetical protein
MKYLLSTLIALIAFAFLVTAPPVLAQTPDGLTPAVEDICTKWDFTGKTLGLCNAYCEAMDCDDLNPQASLQACDRVLAKILGSIGDSPFPTCQDEDGDGIPNGVDNCPSTSNPLQVDTNVDGTGDACSPDACPCNFSAGGYVLWTDAFLAEFGGGDRSTGYAQADASSADGWYYILRVAPSVCTWDAYPPSDSGLEDERGRLQLVDSESAACFDPVCSMSGVDDCDGD